MKYFSKLVVVIGMGMVCNTGCTDIDDARTITFLNNSGEQWHMFASFEGFGPDNRLESGQSRFVNFTRAQTIGGELTMIVGRNQIQEATLTCSFLVEDDGSDVLVGATVTWDGQNLNCDLDTLDDD